jgi:hypothetical protein
MRDSTRGSLPDRASRRPRALDHRQLPVAVRAPDLPAVGRLADRSARRYPSRAITLCPRHRRTTPRRGSGGRFQGNCRENCPEGVTAVTARAAFPLVKHRAAYRNRTDDLFITREDRSSNVLSSRALPLRFQSVPVLRTPAASLPVDTQFDTRDCAARKSQRQAGRCWIRNRRLSRRFYSPLAPSESPAADQHIRRSRLHPGLRPSAIRP